MTISSKALGLSSGKFSHSGVAVLAFVIIRRLLTLLVINETYRFLVGEGGFPGEIRATLHIVGITTGYLEYLPSL